MPHSSVETAVSAADTPIVGEQALSPSESTFIQTHTTAMVVAMRPRLRKQSQDLKAGVPVNITPPVVTGTGTVGQVLTTTNGTWIQAGTYTYQWQRDGTNIAAATAGTYTLVAADSGHKVSCNVTQTTAGKTTTVASNAITVA